MIQIQAYYFCQVFVLDLKNKTTTRSWLVELFQENTEIDRLTEACVLKIAKNYIFLMSEYVL